MDFIAREKEVKAINNLLSQKGYQGGLIYGRRRLGKTALLRHCLLNKEVPCIFFQCTNASEEKNTADLTEYIESVLHQSSLHFSSFIKALKYIFEYSKEKEIYVVLDEYQYLRQQIQGIDSLIQALIDAYQDDSKIKFFLCGSSISIMESLLSAGNPLYRRLHLIMELQELDYYDAAKFYPSFSNEDKVKLYAAFGGIPFYLCQIDSNKTVKDNIITLFTGPYAGLESEITINLMQEISKLSNANDVFEAIALGAFHFSDILNKSHLKFSASLNLVLKKLMDMDLIEKVAPINDPNNKNRCGYRIKDNPTKFFFHYLNKQGSRKNILNPDTFYDVIISQDFETKYVPKAFETIAKQFLIRLNEANRLKPLLLNIGTYWYDDPKKHQNGQFDVVGESKDGYVFYEVKFRNRQIDDKTIEEEIKEVKKTVLNPVQYGFISKSGFSLNDKYSYQFFTLDDMYA